MEQSICQFSVLMSVYKKEKPEYLYQAMESIFNQSLLPSEVVLMEDGLLTEELYQVIDNMVKRYQVIRVFQFKENVQLGRALAKGVELCENELIARMDTDDIAEPNRFLHQCSYMQEHPSVDVCGGWMQEFNDDGDYYRQKKMPEYDEEIRRYGKYRNPINHMTVMFRRSAVLSVGNYRHMPLLEDYDLWTRMMVKKMEFYNIPEVLVKMRNNDEVYQRRGGWTYFQRYVAFRKKQRQMHWLSNREYMVAVLITMGMTLQPAKIRKCIYQKILRK